MASTPSSTALTCGSAASRTSGGHGGQGAGEIVGDAHHVAGEFGHGIWLASAFSLLGAAADILRLRQGAQALVLEDFIFGLQRFQHREFRGMGVFGDRAVAWVRVSSSLMGRVLKP